MTGAPAAHYLDGRTAALRPAEVVVEGEALVVRAEGAAPLAWPLRDLRRIPDQADRGLVLRLASDPLARLVVADPAARRLVEARAPALGRPVPGLMRARWRLIPWGLGAVASVALMIGVLLPAAADRLAPLLPPEGEAALGEVTLARIREALSPHGPGVPLALCEAPAGGAALDRMTERLDPNARLPVEPVVQVLDHPMVNAFALPGGHVVIFRGLIDAAEHPDEVAAVLAHELGHVAAHDPTRIALRSAGSVGVLGLLFGDFAGGALTLALLNTAIEASYTREAEAAADAYARARMIEAGLPPEALATLFERLAAQEGDLPPMLEHFLGHPMLADRIAAARERAPEPDGPPSLDAADWAALRGICG